MPEKLPHSMTACFVAMILSAAAAPGLEALSTPVIVFLLLNAGLVLAMRAIAKWEDTDSMLSFLIGMLSCGIVAVLTDLNMARLLVFAGFAGAVFFARYNAKLETASEIRKPRSR